MLLPRTKQKLSVEEYEALIDSGVLTENDRVELIDGEIVDKMTIGKAHASCVARLHRIFVQRLGAQKLVFSQSPVELSGSLPEPDLLVLRNDPGEYATARPQPEDVLLLIEVADTSLEFDRDEKLSLYAADGIREYWIVNLRDNQLEVFWDPDRKVGRYRNSCVMRPCDRVVPTCLPELEWDVAEMFLVRN